MSATSTLPDDLTDLPRTRRELPIKNDAEITVVIFVYEPIFKF